MQHQVHSVFAFKWVLKRGRNIVFLKRQNPVTFWPQWATVSINLELWSEWCGDAASCLDLLFEMVKHVCASSSDGDIHWCYNDTWVHHSCGSNRGSRKWDTWIHWLKRWLLVMVRENSELYVDSNCCKMPVYQQLQNLLWLSGCSVCK